VDREPLAQNNQCQWKVKGVNRISKKFMRTEFLLYLIRVGTWAERIISFINAKKSATRINCV